MLGEPSEMIHEIKHQSHLIVVGVLILCVLYFLVMKMTAPKKV